MLVLKKETTILILFSVLVTFGVSMIFPYVPVHGREIGIPVGIIGHLVVLYYLLQAVTRIPLGKLSDIIGYHHPVLVGAIFFVFSSLAFVFSTHFWLLLFVGEFFLGLANSVTWVTVPSYITHNDNVMPLFTFSLGLGWLMGSPVGGFIKDNLGMQWVFNYQFLVSLGLLGLALAFYFFESNVEFSRQNIRSFLRFGKFSPGSLPIYPSVQSYVKAWRLLVENKRLLAAGLFSFLVFMTFGLGASIVPLYFSEVGISSLFIGVLVSVRTSTSTAVRLLSNRVTSRFGEMKVLITSTTLVGICMVLLSFVENLGLLLILSAFWGLCAGYYLPVVFQIIGNSTRKEDRGMAMGVRGTMGTLGAASGTLLFSYLADIFSLSFALFLAGLVAAIGSLIVGRLVRY